MYTAPITVWAMVETKQKVTYRVLGIFVLNCQATVYYYNAVGLVINLHYQR